MTDNETTKFLNEKYMQSKDDIRRVFHSLESGYHLNVAFYRNGCVRIAKVQNGNSARTSKAIIAVYIDPVYTSMEEMGPRILEAIKNRVQRT